MAITVNKKGATYTATGGVEILNMTVYADSSGKYCDIPHTLYIECLSGDFAYEIVSKGASAPAMTTATVYTPTNASGTNNLVLPPITFNPFNSNLYIKATASSTFTLTS